MRLRERWIFPVFFPVPYARTYPTLFTSQQELLLKHMQAVCLLLGIWAKELIKAARIFGAM